MERCRLMSDSRAGQWRRAGVFKPRRQLRVTTKQRERRGRAGGTGERAGWGIPARTASAIPSALPHCAGGAEPPPIAPKPEHNTATPVFLRFIKNSTEKALSFFFFHYSNFKKG